MARRTLSLPFSPTRLCEARELQGMPIKELAARAGLDASIVGRYESGHRIPSAGSLGKLAEALGLRIEDLLTPAQAAS